MLFAVDLRLKMPVFEGKMPRSLVCFCNSVTAVMSLDLEHEITKNFSKSKIITNEKFKKNKRS